jgi:hypothetical protein
VHRRMSLGGRFAKQPPASPNDSQMYFDHQTAMAKKKSIQLRIAI